MGFCHNFQKQPTTNQNYNKNLLYISKNKTHKEILEILAQIQRNPKNKKKWKNGAVVVRMRATGGAPKSQLWVDRQYGLCW
jgi:hypothetical protein